MIKKKLAKKDSVIVVLLVLLYLIKLKLKLIKKKK